MFKKIFFTNVSERKQIRMSIERTIVTTKTIKIFVNFYFFSCLFTKFGVNSAKKCTWIECFDIIFKEKSINNLSVICKHG